MRIALVNEGTYPYVAGGVSTWCHQLTTGLSQHTFRLVAIGAQPPRQRPAYQLPDNAVGVSFVPVWDRPAPVPVAGRLARRRHVRAATDAAVLLGRGLLGDGPDGAEMFAAALRQLTGLAAPGVHPLYDVPLGEILSDIWNTARTGAGGGDPTGPGDAERWPPLPKLTLRDAHHAATLIEHAVRPLAYELPPVDVCHAVAAGLPVLVALAARWRYAVPYLLTEHGVYLRERYLELPEAVPVAVKAVMLRFYRALARLGYAEAALVTSVSQFNQRWQLRHGAAPGQVLVVPNGVASQAYQPLETEPDAPTVVWVGRIDPLKDLHTLIRAFELVRRELPPARLRLAGPVPATGRDYARSCRDLVVELGLADAVEFVGPVASSREAFATGTVVALSSISEGMPYSVIEAMMCGRATVNTDVGGVSDTVGEAGLVVPPGDPAAFAAACLGLLRDPAGRHTLADAAVRRARAHFALDQMLTAYDRLYTDVRHSDLHQPGAVTGRRVFPRQFVPAPVPQPGRDR